MNTISSEATRVLHASVLKSQYDAYAILPILRPDTAVLLFCMRNGVVSQFCHAAFHGFTNEQGVFVLQCQMDNHPLHSDDISDSLQFSLASSPLWCTTSLTSTNFIALMSILRPLATSNLLVYMHGTIRQCSPLLCQSWLPSPHVPPLSNSLNDADDKVVLAEVSDYYGQAITLPRFSREDYKWT